MILLVNVLDAAEHFLLARIQQVARDKFGDLLTIVQRERKRFVALRLLLVSEESRRFDERCPCVRTVSCGRDRAVLAQKLHGIHIEAL